MNTYPWIKATAISNTIKHSCAENIGIRDIIDVIPPPVNLSSKCPATIFAINRIDSVIGRITDLIVSIITIKGIKIFGAPTGTRCVNLWLGLIIHLFEYNPSHIGMANLIGITMWAVGVNT